MDNIQNEKKYLKPADVFGLYGISRSSFYRHLNAGHFNAVKIGRSTRVEAQSVAEFFANAPKFSFSPSNQQEG